MKGWRGPADMLTSYRALEKMLGSEKLPLPRDEQDRDGYERVYKALGRPDGLSWTEIEIVPDEHGAPVFQVRGGAAEAVRGHGVERLHLSMTHDAGVAVAYVVAEGAPSDRGFFEVADV